MATNSKLLKSALDVKDAFEGFYSNFSYDYNFSKSSIKNKRNFLLTFFNAKKTANMIALKEQLELTEKLDISDDITPKHTKERLVLA